VLAWIFAALATGSCVYCILVLAAVWSYRRQPRPAFATELPLSVLKPLAGIDDGLEQNLRSVFEQDYSTYEILFAVRDPGDPAVPLVQRLQAEYAGVPSRLLIVGEPPWPNPKVWSLHRMTGEARHDVLVMSDSDIRLRRDFLRDVAADFRDERLGVATYPYRAVGGPRLASALEAIGMNTEFLSGVLVARMLEGVKFALGPTLAARKLAVEDAGAWPALAEFLAEDFVLGNRTSSSTASVRRLGGSMRGTACAGFAAHGVRGRRAMSASCSRIRRLLHYSPSWPDPSGGPSSSVCSRCVCWPH
jgi:ceramide glucosyltransferase